MLVFPCSSDVALNSRHAWLPAGRDAFTCSFTVLSALKRTDNLADIAAHFTGIDRIVADYSFRINNEAGAESSSGLSIIYAIGFGNIASTVR